MIIFLKPQATPEGVQEILTHITSIGLTALTRAGNGSTSIIVIGDEGLLPSVDLKGHSDVEEIKAIRTPYKLVSRETHSHDTVVTVGGVPIGGQRFAVIAGPCSVESHSQMRNTALAVKAAGAVGLRAGAFKPRSSPYAFQGLGLKGLEILRDVGSELAMPVITEVMDTADVDMVAAHAQCLQIGARNMHNSSLLKAVGQLRMPVVLKRGMSAKVEDLLLAAEYILAEGNDQVILCERGIRTFETATRNTLDLNAIPYLKQRTHLPVVVDPSHGTGVRSLVTPMAKAAAACGADGILVEVHENPKVALSDGAQSLDLPGFQRFMQELGPVVRALGREMP